MQWYGRSMREVMRNSLSAEQRKLTRDQLEVVLMTCVLLLAYEYWSGNLANGNKHIVGAVRLLEGHEASDKGKGRAGEETGILETLIGPAVQLCAACHRRCMQIAGLTESEPTTTGAIEQQEIESDQP